LASCQFESDKKFSFFSRVTTDSDPAPTLMKLLVSKRVVLKHFRNVCSQELVIIEGHL